MFGGIPVRLHAEFLHAVDAQHHARHARRRAIRDIRDVGAVHQVTGLFGPCAADRQLHFAETAGLIGRARAAGDDAGLQGRELHEVPAVQRQLGDLLGGDDAAGGRRADGHGGRFTRHRHLLGEVADRHLDVDQEIAIELHCELVADDRPKALKTGRETIEARRQIERPIPPLLVRHVDALEPGIQVGDGQGHPRHDRLRRVHHGAGDAAGGLRRRQAGHERQHSGNDPNEEPGSAESDHPTLHP